MKGYKKECINRFFNVIVQPIGTLAYYSFFR